MVVTAVTTSTLPETLINSVTFRELLGGISTATFDRMVARRALPEQVRVGGSHLRRWRLDDVRAWLDTGCPSQEDWIAIKAAGRKSAR